jgi:hypothetical protein
MAYPQSAPELNAGGIGYGYTTVPLPTMQNFVSSQTYAVRSASNDRFGFAWVTATTFSSIVDRFATALHDSESDPARACGPTGDSCTGTIDGAQFTETWKALATWSPPTNTPEGSQVTVHVAPGVTVTYPTVSSRGSTQATSVTPVPAPPPGFQRLPGAPAYSIDTTAAFAGQLDVCLDVATATFAGYAPALFELDGGTWAALAAGGDTTAGSICASAPDLGTFAVFAGDPTPPIVVAHVEGQLGNDGWYISGVTVTWETSDPQSPIASTTGCTPTTIDTDTIGTRFECTATSAGGPTTEAVTIKRDTTPPTLTVPASVAADATSASGATVSFDVSATDALDPTPSYLCLPASGSLFPIGTTPVTCTATDSAGNRSAASFSVHVRGAGEQVRALATSVGESTAIPHGAKVSLLAKLDVVLARLDSAETMKACKHLDAFASELRGLEQMLISPEVGNQLLADVGRIDAVLGC